MKINPLYTIFEENMFVQLQALLDPIESPAALPILDMSIGEPQQPVTKLLTDSMSRYNEEWQFYPKPTGTPRFIEAVEKYIAKRWPNADGLVESSQIIPVPGTREPLHLLGHIVAGGKENAAALVTNPFYHAWRAGALASGGEIIYLNCDPNDNFLPNLWSLDSKTLDRTSILFLCSPTNPQGSIMDLDYLLAALQLARAHDFLLVMDECYTDIWREKPPPGIMEAAVILANQGGISSDHDPVANMVVLNSLSKRSGAAGLRAGFMLGDRQVIAKYLQLVGNGGSLVPTPLLSVAADLYEDDAHVADIRAYYNANFALAERHLGISPPRGGFFLWLKVDDDLQFVKQLMAEQSVKALPGSLMGMKVADHNPGAGYVRLALVHDNKITDEAMGRIAKIYNGQP